MMNFASKKIKRISGWAAIVHDQDVEDRFVDPQERLNFLHGSTAKVIFLFHNQVAALLIRACLKYSWVDHAFLQFTLNDLELYAGDHRGALVGEVFLKVNLDSKRLPLFLRFYEIFAINKELCNQVWVADGDSADGFV